MMQEEEKGDFGKLAFEGLMGGLQQPSQTRKLHHRPTKTRIEETTSLTTQDDTVEPDTRWHIEPLTFSSWLMYTSAGVIAFVAVIYLYHIHWQNYVEMFTVLFSVLFDAPWIIIIIFEWRNVWLFFFCVLNQFKDSVFLCNDIIAIAFDIWQKLTSMTGRRRAVAFDVDVLR